ncbi:hypothetical protein [Anaerostipes caccae]
MEKQNGEEKDEHGVSLIAELSKQMNVDFRKVFTATNLKNMR